MDRRCSLCGIQNLLNLGHCDRISEAMAGTEQEPAYLTFSYRGKDATSGKHLVALGNATNTVLELLQRNQRAIGSPWSEMGDEKAAAGSDERSEQGARPAVSGDPGNHRRVHRQAEARAPAETPPKRP